MLSAEISNNRNGYRGYWRRKEHGFVALVSVLIIGAIGVTVAVALLLFSIASIQNGEMIELSAKARYLADACGEVALSRVRENPSYTGGETVQIGETSCEINPVETVTEGVVVIQTVGSVDDVVRKVEIRTSRLRPSVAVDTWQEVGVE